jgi:hypothetical protein
MKAFRWVWALDALVAMALVWTLEVNHTLTVAAFVTLFAVAAVCTWLAVRPPSLGPKPQRPPGDK